MAMLDSSFLLNANYDAQTRTLNVTFKNGRTYTYPNVPADVYSGLMDADSAGTYFHENIKDQY